MTTFTIGRDGQERVHTNVAIPRHLRDYARENNISMSRLLEKALNKECCAGGDGQ